MHDAAEFAAIAKRRRCDASQLAAEGESGYPGGTMPAGGIANTKGTDCGRIILSKGQGGIYLSLGEAGWQQVACVEAGPVLHAVSDHAILRRVRHRCAG